MGICGRVLDVLTRVKCQIYVPLIHSRTANKCYEIRYCLEMKTKDTLAWCWRSPNFMVILNPNRISSQYLFRFFSRCFESKITIKMILRKIKTLTLPAFMHAMHSKICRWTDGQPLFSECLYGCCKTLLHRLYVPSLPKLSKERPLLCLQTRRNVIELLNSTSKKPGIVFVHLRVSLVVKQCWN